MNSTLRAALGLAILVALTGAARGQGQPPQNQPAQNQPAEDQSAQSQSLGDVARAQRQKKTSAKVIDDEAMAQRRAQRGAGESALQCDADCAAAVKDAVQQNSNLKMNEVQWQTALVAGEDELAQDDEWSQLFSEIQERICHKTAGAADPVKAQDLDRRIAKKILDDVRENMDGISHAMEAGSNQAAINRAMDSARARAVKLQIVKVLVERAKRVCSVSPSSTKAAATN